MATHQEFVADAIVASLRAGNHPDDHEALSLNTFPFIDQLRRRMTADDLAWLWPVVDKEASPVAALFLSLLRRFTGSEEVQSRLRERWESANPFLRSHLAFRLLDDPSLPAGWHERLFEFMQTEWPVMKDTHLRYVGGPSKALALALRRLGDPAFPETKKWAYLCCLPAADDEASARALVSLGRLLPDPFTRQVAAKLLQRFWPERDAGPTLTTDTFVGDAIVTSLRTRNRPADAEAWGLIDIPLIGQLRRGVKPDDVPWLLAVVERESNPVSFLFLALLQGFTNTDEMQRRLRARWDTADASLRTHLLWRLLDNPTLPAEWHERLFGHVLAEWQIFKETWLKYCGGPALALNRALRRLGDPSFPASKKWAYLCCLPEAAEDEEAARSLVSLGRLLPDPFTRKVADKLVERFWPDRGNSRILRYSS